MHNPNFFPDGWDHLADSFTVKQAGLEFHVRRRPPESRAELVVFVNGIGEQFSNAGSAVQFIRTVARVAGTFQEK